MYKELHMHLGQPYILITFYIFNVKNKTKKPNTVAP